MFKLNNLKSPTGSRHSKTRKGLGNGSGFGKTAGRGHKGQKARSGGKVPAGFEGGQVPLQRRLPKVGFKSPLKANNAKVNISELGAFAGRDLKLTDLAPASLKNNPRLKVNVFGNYIATELPKSLEAHHVSPKAKSLLEEKGVQVTIVEHKDGARDLKALKKAAKQA